MYRLFYGWYKHLTRTEEFFCLIIGLDDAGKTTLLEKISEIYNEKPSLPAQKISPTIGQNVQRIKLSSSTLTFWDLGGQRDIRGIWRKYYSQAHGVMFVIDSTDGKRLKESREVLLSHVIDSEDLEGIPFLVLANKSDLDQTADMIPIEELKDLFTNPIAERMGAGASGVEKVSALSGQGVRTAVEWVFARMQRNSDARAPIYR